MKYVIMTEGTCEKAFLDVLVDKNMLFVSLESLLYEEIFHARQIKSSLLEKINQLPINEKIIIIRVGDKLSDELKIPEEIEERVSEALKICIKPEFEILHLLHEGKDSDYLKKHKTDMKASEYLKSINCDYCKTYEYNYAYFYNMSKGDLIKIVKNYSKTRKRVHKKDEMTLEYLIKEN